MSSTLCLARPLRQASRHLASSHARRCIATTSKQMSLSDIIRNTIKATGPISVARYMQLCLTHPTEGYYSKGDVFGKQGDFITSPEISQVFGELVGIWLLTRWMAAGSPKKCHLVELGPGRGTLMDDILRTFLSFPAISSSISSITLVENSLKMRELQKDVLARRIGQRDIKLDWVDKVDDVPEGDFTMVVAHEFFDAMPINLFERSLSGWREVLVDLEPAYDQSLPTGKKTFRLAMSREPNSLSTVLPATSPRFASLPTGSRVEIASESWKISRRIGELIKSGEGGAGLVIDYGGDRHYGSSFRAFRNHKIVDVFEEPGSADLTANVDFAYLRESLAGTHTRSLGPINQSKFLLSLGLEPRLSKLLDSAASAERKEDIRKAAARLIDPLGMGSQYQVMGVVPEGEEEVYPFVK